MTTTPEPYFVRNLKWTTNRYNDYFATAENSSYRIETRNDGQPVRVLIRSVAYTGPESLPTSLIIAKVKTLKEAKAIAERDRYLTNTLGDEYRRNA